MRLIATYTGLYLILGILFGCTLKEAQIAEEIMEGEVSIFEKAIEDCFNVQPDPSANKKPAIVIPLKKF